MPTGEVLREDPMRLHREHRAEELERFRICSTLHGTDRDRLLLSQCTGTTLRAPWANTVQGARVSALYHREC